MITLSECMGEILEGINETYKTSGIIYRVERDVDAIASLYDTYPKTHEYLRKMHPLGREKIGAFLEQGYAFVGAYKEDGDLIGIAVSRKFPDNYKYFVIPQNETKGDVFTLGGLYVRPDQQGKFLGLSKNIVQSITDGTKIYGQRSGKVVGLGFEVSFDNPKSWKNLTKYGNYIGHSIDTDGQEGLSILLYTPFFHDPIEISKNEPIELNPNEGESLIILDNTIDFLSKNPKINGYSTIEREMDNGSILTLKILNQTPNTAHYKGSQQVSNPMFC